MKPIVPINQERPGRAGYRKNIHIHLKPDHILLFFLALFYGTSFSASAQRMITGRLIDKDSGIPIKNATITTATRASTTEVNVLGFFQLEIDSTNIIIIESQTYPIMTVKVPAVNSFKIEMTRANTDLKEGLGLNDKLYFDAEGLPAQVENAKYYRIVSSHPIEVNKLLIKEFHLDGLLKEVGSYSDKDMRIRDGFFTEYYRNGTKKAEGFYRDDIKQGKWIKWYKNNQIQEIVTHSRDGEYYQRIENYWDSLGHQHVKDGSGNYIEYEEDFQGQYSKGRIQNGLKTGKWTGYFKNGEIYYEEEYKENKLVKGLSFDSNGNTYSYSKVDDFDLFTFYKFVGEEINYPPNARRKGIEGNIILQVFFNYSGQVINEKIIKGIGSECDEEALRAVKMYKGLWNQPKRRGQPASRPRTMFLPITFKLG